MEAAKLNVLKDYHKWLFVVTNRNKVSKYKKFGDAVDRRYLKNKLNKFLRSIEKIKK